MSDKQKILKYSIFTFVVLLLNVFMTMKTKGVDFDYIITMASLLLSAIFIFYYLYNKTEYVKQGYKTFKTKTIFFIGMANAILSLLPIYNIFHHQNNSFWCFALFFILVTTVSSYKKLEKTYNILKNKLPKDINDK